MGAVAAPRRRIRRVTGYAVAYDTVYLAGARRDGSSSDPTAILDACSLAGCGQATCAPAWTLELGPTRPAREPTVAGGVVPAAGVDELGRACGAGGSSLVAALPASTVW